MAARRSMSADNMDTTTEDVLSAILAEDATEDVPTTFIGVAAEMGITVAEVMDALENVDESFVDSDRQGNVWLTRPYKDTETMLRAFKVTHPGKPTPAPRKTAAKAVQPVKGKDGKNVTVPVAEGSTERRELDASKGERVISEESMREAVKSLAKSEESTPVVTSWENPEHESKLTPEHESGQYLAPADRIPAPPEGINWNKWELVFTAPTRQGRAYWHAQCLIDLERWNAGADARKAAANAAAQAEADKLAAEAAKAAEPEPVRICPMTGEVLPF